MASTIPKTIWMYWAQGISQAPFLVRECLQSWKKKNPGWEVILLSDETVGQYVEIEEYRSRKDIGLQAWSDILRLALLARHGGVWVDASLVCCKPLDDWLEDALEHGFFAFKSRRSDRWMTTWFLAANQDSEILAAWNKSVREYWDSNNFVVGSNWRRQVIRRLTSLRKRHVVSNEIWFSKWITKALRYYPYPINMYLFEKALSGNHALSRMWSECGELFDEEAEYLQNVLGVNTSVSDESRRFICSEATPVHKLNWRQDQGCAVSGSNLELLLETI